MTKTITNHNLTNYKEASLKEFTRLVIPCVLILLTGALMNFIDRTMLYRYSYPVATACNIAGYLGILFQIPLTLISQGAQVYVSRNYGAGTYDKIGNIIWQIIYFTALLYPLIIVLGFIAEYFFIKGTEAETLASAYFRILIFGIPLFGLNATLSTFFIGRGKTKVVLVTTLAALVVNILLNYLLIFGWGKNIPELGIEGAAYATIFSLFFSFVVFFFIFLCGKDHNLYKTRNCHFKLQSLLKILKIGIPRSLMTLSFYIIGLSCTNLMIKKGGDYLDLVSITIFFTSILSVLRIGLTQTVITIVSFLIGKNKTVLIPKVLAKASIFITISFIFLSIPLIFQSNTLISLFFGESLNNDKLSLLIKSCIGIWLFSFLQNFSAMFIGILTATKDTFFHFLVSQLFWITTYLPLYYAINIANLPPIIYFTIYCAAFLIELLILGYRIRKKIWKNLTQDAYGSH